MRKLVKRGITITAILALLAGMGYLAKKSYNKKKQSTFSAQLSGGRVNYNETPDCVTVEDPQYDAAYPLDPRDGCEPLKCARHALATSKHLTDDDQIPISNGNDSAISNLEGCLRQHPGGTAFMVGHGQQGEIDTAFAGYDWYLSNGNYSQWKNEFPRLQPYKPSDITLWGCSTGGYPNGPGLLRQIKKDVCPPQNACTTSIKSPTVTVFCDENGLYFSNGEQWNDGTESPAPQGASTRTSPGAGGPVRTQSPQAHEQTTLGEYSADKFSKILWEQNGRVFRPPLVSPEDKSDFFKEIDFANRTETSGCPVARKMGVVELHPSQGEKLFFVMYSNGLVRDLSKTDVKVYYQGSDALVRSWMNFLKPH